MLMMLEMLEMLRMLRVLCVVRLALVWTLMLVVVLMLVLVLGRRMLVLIIDHHWRLMIPHGELLAVGADVDRGGVWNHRETCSSGLGLGGVVSEKAGCTGWQPGWIHDKRVYRRARKTVQRIRDVNGVSRHSQYGYHDR